MTVVLGLDLATVTGYAFGGRGQKPSFGTFKLPGLSDEDRARSFASIYSTVRMLVRDNAIAFAIIEAPMGPGARKENRRGVRTPTSYHGIEVLTMLSGAAQAGVIAGGAKVLEMPDPPVWRKAVLGEGFPDDPKVAAVRYCDLSRWNIAEHNAAEAACLVVYGHAKLWEREQLAKAR